MLILEFVYIYLVTVFTQVRLQNFVVCAFFITKVCSVHFFWLQKFVVSSVHFFQTTNVDYKICSVRIFSLQKFVVVQRNYKKLDIDYKAYL